MNKVDRALNLWVFGPGFGELIVVHVPGSGWLTVDGCSAQRTSWPLAFFEQFNAAPTHVLMTHPHLDHAGGLLQLIDEYTQPGEQWPRLGVLEPVAPPGAAASQETHFHGQQADAVLTAMRTRWTSSPSCKWPLEVGTSEPVGDGWATVLSPEPDAGGADVNERATALEIRWKNAQLLLGADLIETPGLGWTRALARRPALREHHAIKVAHHGSLAAQHAPVLQRSAAQAEALTVVTPYSKGHKLPDFAADGGVELLLRHTSRVLMTALPQSYETQNRNPRTWTRSELDALQKPVAAAEPVGPFPSCFVHAAFDAEGALILENVAGVAVTRG